MDEPKEKLLLLIDSDANKKLIDYYVAFLSEMNVPDDLGTAMSRSDQRWGAGYGQMFGPLMKKLYDSYPNIKERVHSRLNSLGIKDEWIAKYFEKYIKEGSYMIGMLMREIPKEEKRVFIKEIDQLMLDTLKEYSGLESKV